MKKKKALVRPPGLSFCNCISTHPDRFRVSLRKALEQHEKYCETLEHLGLEIIRLPILDDMPDSCFVEDIALLMKNKAIITRPATKARRREIEPMRKAVEETYEVYQIQGPGTLEGGDVIITDRILICGLTQRTNKEGVKQLTSLLKQEVHSVVDSSIIHLKSFFTFIQDSDFVSMAKYANHRVLSEFNVIEIPNQESLAANTLTVEGVIILPTDCPESEKMLNERGYETISLNMSEFNKCDGALTCLSIIF